MRPASAGSLAVARGSGLRTVGGWDDGGVSQSKEKARRRAVREALRVAEMEKQRFARLSCVQKLRRAEHHITNLEAAIASWRRTGYRVFEETDDQGMITEYGELLRPIPESIPLLIGDAAQCLLNSLDHLAFAIAGGDRGGLAEGEEKDSAFPILSTAPKTTKPDKRTIHWPAEALLVLDAMQPYRSEEGSDAHPLWLLRDLANRDKHRRIAATVFTQSTREITMGNGFLDALRLFDDAELGAKPVPLIAYSRRNHGDIQVRRSLNVRFSEGPLVAGQEVAPTLRMVAQFVEHVAITQLSVFIPRGADNQVTSRRKQ